MLSFDKPVFVCGYPKSGTTLLVSLLDGHSDLLVIPEETQFFSKVHSRAVHDKFETLFKDTNISAIARGIVDAPSGYRDYTKIDFDFMHSSAMEYWKNSPKSDKHLLESVVYGLAEATRTRSFRHWVEKTPLSELHLGTIRKWWPRVMAILTVRDPRQTFCSHREYQKRKQNPLKITLDVFTNQWTQSATSFKTYMRQGGKGIVIRYEDLTQNTTDVMKKIAKFIGIPFRDCLLCPTRSGNEWGGNPASGNEFKGVSFRPNNYMEKLEEAEIRGIELCLSTLMREFGYKCTYRQNAFDTFHIYLTPFVGNNHQWFFRRY